MGFKVADFFAAVGIRVSRSEFQKAEGALDQFAGVHRDAMGRLREANGRFVKEGSAAWDHFNAGATKSKKTAVSWKNAWRGALYTVGAMWAATALIKKGSAYADAYNGAASRVRLLTDDLQKQKEINDALFQSAQNTGTAFADTAQLYQQVGKAAIDNGRSLEQGVAIVDTINKAIKASGAGGDAASAALKQLAQGLGSGTLRGEEFNSVIEQAPFLLDIIAKDIGKTRGEMRKLAESGKLTSKVILGALERQKDAVEEAYGKRIPLISEGFARMRNQVEKTFGELMQDREVANAFATAMRGITVAVIALIKSFAATVVFFTRHKKVFYTTVIALTAALIAFKIAAIAAWLAFLGPIVLIVAALVGLALYWEDLVGLFFAGFMKLGEGFAALIRRIERWISALARTLTGLPDRIGTAIKNAFDRAFDYVHDLLDGLINRLNNLKNEIKTKGIAGTITDALGLPGLSDLPGGGVMKKILKHSPGVGPIFGGSPFGAAGDAVNYLRDGGPLSSNTRSTNVRVDGVQIHVSNPDPAAAAQMARVEFESYLGEQLRTAADAIG